MKSDPRDGLPATPNEKKCAICLIARTEHDTRVRAGELHHAFSENGELIHSTPRKPEARRVTVTADLALRVALIEAGVITYEQLARAEAALREVPDPGRQGSRGDREDRPAEGAERGGRADGAPESSGEGCDR